ncbi:patatin-like phospholipase [Luteibacter rhizovicinus]|uniref:Patatin-like phospholipase n=1 Tax=Luteibacter rhizovicinus TaxID=242606 RepID=A0A4R3YG37_9GAMM|nr:CBASS cGAMP-activated phospholipase [Luteibacter rhizovicinus]TCV91100.1 patatin-like phospholipase [Luteibacter rhizovicinus]
MPFTILALSGGGYLGLHEAVLLRELERTLHRPIGEAFDLICGSSIGAVAAMALAAGAPARDIEAAFLTHGTDIFPGHRWRSVRPLAYLSSIRYMFHSRYRGEAIGATVDAILGEKRTLKDAKTRLVIPVINASIGRLEMIKTPHTTRNWYYSDLSMSDIATAATAAPTYFPLANLRDQLYVDAGIFANSPGMFGMHEASHYCKVPIADIHMLSLGTNVASPRHLTRERRNLGALGWLKNGRLYTTMSSAQRELTDSILRHILDERYHRIEGTPDTTGDSLLQFDNASIAASKRLTELAEHAWKEAYARPSTHAFIEMLRTHEVDSSWRAVTPMAESVDTPVIDPG